MTFCGDFPRPAPPGIPTGGFILSFAKEVAPTEPLPSHDSPLYEEPPMEDLMKLVADSFLRHGIECPAGDSVLAPVSRPTEPPPISALPEHSFRKKPEAEIAT
jgi:hypothetical protein